MLRESRREPQACVSAGCRVHAKVRHLMGILWDRTHRARCVRVSQRERACIASVRVQVTPVVYRPEQGVETNTNECQTPRPRSQVGNMARASHKLRLRPPAEEIFGDTSSFLSLCTRVEL